MGSELAPGSHMENGMTRPSARQSAAGRDRAAAERGRAAAVPLPPAAGPHNNKDHKYQT